MYNTKKKFKFYDKSKTEIKRIKGISIHNKLENKLKNKIDGIISSDILNRIKINFEKNQKSIVSAPTLVI